MIRRFFKLGIVMFLIIFAVNDNQGLAIESDEKIKIEHHEELPDEIDIRPIELLDPILDATIKPIELLEPMLDIKIKPVELLEPKLSEETKSDELKEKLEK
ncbi:MAG: hypothetical protein RBR71_11025 [Gudongella sp.]|nr:hypothetical protein [Gudongella sp.]